MSYDVNLSILFTDLPMLDRPAAAAGYRAIELWWPFAGPVPPDTELDALAMAIERAGVQLVCLNFDGGDLAAGDRGLLSRPAQLARFRDNLDVAIGFADRLGCAVLNYPIRSSSAALRVIDTVRAVSGMGNIAFLADFYHLDRMGEDLGSLIALAADRFGHVQLADVPGRGKPGTGEILFDSLLALLDASPYRGYVGLEYQESV